MRHFLIYFAVVTVISAVAASGELNICPGSIYEVNLLIQYPLSSNVSWAGIYGDLNVESPEDANYYSSAFGYVEINPADLNDHTASVGLDNSNKKLRVTDLTNWYLVMSENGDLNFLSLRSTCDENLDSLLSEGNFCDACSPNITFDRNEYILVDDTNYCARVTDIYENVPAYILLADDSNVVYISKVGDYNILGDSHNFGLLISLPDTTRFYIYLVPAERYCGDGICDPGEPSNCSDCVSISLNVTPTSIEANAGQTVQYNATLENTGFRNVSSSLSVHLISGDESDWSATLSSSTPTLSAGSETNITISATANASGTYEMVLTADCNGLEFNSNVFALSIPSSSAGDENSSAPSSTPSSGDSNNLETNDANAVQLDTGEFYIPWARCISSIRLSGPDRVNSKLDENVVINILVQNSGTCDENVEVNVGVSPAEDISADPDYFSLEPGERRQVSLHVVPKRSGLHHITISVGSLVARTHRMDLFVSNERAAGGSGGCESSIQIESPEDLVIVEGEDANAIPVKNTGTCREYILIVLAKQVGGADIVLDRKELHLSGGESYHYLIPKLAAGEYVLRIESKGVEKRSKIKVVAKSLFSVEEDVLVRARLAAVVFMVMLLFFVGGYLRYQYMR